MANYSRSLFVDVTILLFLGFSVLFYFLGEPYKRGFFCNDSTIRYPYRPNTVTTPLLIVITIVLPCLFIIALESAKVLSGNRLNVNIWSPLVRRCYKPLKVFVLGLGLNQVTVDMAKYTIGRLRPNFFDVCKPDLICDNRGLYITSYHCLNDDESAIQEARLSFPSGHTALSFYSCVYMMVYMHKRIHLDNFGLGKHVGQFVLFLVAWYIALSRVKDNMHHPTDVLAGIIIGTMWGIIMVTMEIDLGSNKHYTDEETQIYTQNAHIAPV